MDNGDRLQALSLPGDDVADAAGRDDPTRTSLQVLDRAFAILDLFTVDRSEWTTTEIARACDLPVPTAHRILATLRAHRYVDRDDLTKRHRLGVAAIELGRRGMDAASLRSISQPYLRRVADQVDEAALLTVPHTGDRTALCSFVAHSSSSLRLGIREGRVMPLHAGAGQKAILAFSAQEVIDRVLASPMERVCRATITDASFLEQHLDRIRDRGWAISLEETTPGAWAAAVPVMRAGTVYGSIGVVGPRARFSRRQLSDSIWRLELAAEEIAARMSERGEWTP
jgi:DNA-binding IclR family transcriptional regulator